jgi:CRISPR-associated protein Cas8c/Csd1, subtype I-C/DVULG
MSWIENLSRTYELQPQSAIGRSDEGTPLLPLCHTTNKAQIEIILDAEGNFRGAKVVDEVTIIPCTEESSGRTSGPAPHPLCDKLQYVAGDYVTFCDGGEDRFPLYERLLSGWVGSTFMHPKAATILKYIERKQVIADLIAAKIFFTGPEGIVLDKWTEGDPVPAIFKARGSVKIAPTESFVRWRVELPGSADDTTWTDRSLWKSWEDYYASTKRGRGLCFVTGEESPIATQHPAKLRNAADKAKLISSNDGSGFTFRGRFTEADQVAGVSLEVTQKAHSALRWLIGRQGSYDAGFAVVAWAVWDGEVRVPDPIVDSFDCFAELAGVESAEPAGTIFTGQDLALRLKALAAGYSSKLGSTRNFVVMGIDSATTGRMALKFYRELGASEYLSRIAAWHEGCCWPQNFGKDRKFIGAPSPRDIAEACYGRRLDDKLRAATVERLLPCIVDGAPLPRDIVEAAVRRAANHAGFENDWEWEKALGIACALYRKHYESRGYKMEWEPERTTRDYLYGCLLAVADAMEASALKIAEESRPTTAMRMMQRFASYPFSTWENIELALDPYIRRLGPAAIRYEKYFDQIHKAFDKDEYVIDKPLTGEFLLGFHCLRSEIYKAKNDKNVNEDSDTTEPEVKK